MKGRKGCFIWKIQAKLKSQEGNSYLRNTNQKKLRELEQSMKESGYRRSWGESKTP